MPSREILLIEPGYPNKYPPLGLMKLAAYHGPLGHRDHVTFIKGEIEEVLNRAWDRVYVTTLFTFEWKRTASAIDFAIRAAGNQPERVFVGGIAVPLMYDAFLNEPRWAGVRFIKGLLDGPPAASLDLSALEDGTRYRPKRRVQSKQPHEAPALEPITAVRAATSVGDLLEGEDTWSRCYATMKTTTCIRSLCRCGR